MQKRIWSQIVFAIFLASLAVILLSIEQIHCHSSKYIRIVEMLDGLKYVVG